MPFNSTPIELVGFFFARFYLNCVPNQIRVHNNNLRLIITINDIISLNLKLYNKKALTNYG